MSNHSSNQPLVVDVLLKSGKTVQVNLEELEAFWETNADKIQVQQELPRRPRRNQEKSISKSK